MKPDFSQRYYVFISMRAGWKNPMIKTFDAIDRDERGPIKEITRDNWMGGNAPTIRWMGGNAPTIRRYFDYYFVRLKMHDGHSLVRKSVKATAREWRLP